MSEVQVANSDEHDARRQSHLPDRRCEPWRRRPPLVVHCCFIGTSAVQVFYCWAACSSFLSGWLCGREKRQMHGASLPVPSTERGCSRPRNLKGHTASDPVYTPSGGIQLMLGQTKLDTASSTSRKSRRSTAVGSDHAVACHHARRTAAGLGTYLVDSRRRCRHLRAHTRPEPRVGRHSPRWRGT